MGTEKCLFIVRDADRECGGAFVAENVAEAKKMALREGIAEEWTQLRVQKHKKDVLTWDKGLVDYKRCLREGVFGYIEDDCDKCKKYGMLSQVIIKTGECICSDCEDKIGEEKEAV